VESLESLLTGVETIPAVIHVGIQLVHLGRSLFSEVDWLLSSIHFVKVVTFEGEDTKALGSANPCVPFLYLLACINVRGKSTVIGDNLEVTIK
jgi:hypothetical protein